MNWKGTRATGVLAALASASLLGFAPIFGRQAILGGLSPFAVVAIRTSAAALLLLIIMLIFKRPFLYIFWVGLLGCFAAGAINGLGSLLYYVALQRLDASVGQLLYSLYPLFVAFWLILDHQPPTRLTLFRIFLGAVAVLLLTASKSGGIDFPSVGLMIGAAALYALHLPINQRVLYEIPAPTVTLYTLISMSIIVVPAFFIFDGKPPQAPAPAWTAVGALTFVTFFSRLTLFLGVKHLGGMQTALLGLGELVITLLFSYLLLKESLNFFQILGATALGASLLLAAFDKTTIEKRSTGWLSWIRPPAPPNITWDVNRE